ncbi:MAG TPA: hypothetical protein VII29_07095, partial [Terriglobales bacterium]
WSLSNAFTSAFKELEPIPHLKDPVWPSWPQKANGNRSDFGKPPDMRRSKRYHDNGKIGSSGSFIVQ